MPLDHRPRRSALFVPAANPRALAKAPTLDADMILIDLEDAVAPEEKAAARSAALAAAASGPREVLIRCNGLATDWGFDDLAAIAGARADGVLVPKVLHPDDVDAAHAALADAPAPLSLWVMIETCAAVGQLAAIAARARDTRLAGFVLGTNDLAKEMRVRPSPDRLAMLAILSLSVAAARAAGLVVLDGVCNTLDDPAALAAECAQGALLGFDGKTLIHPAQIAPCNAAFSPRPEEVAEAHAIVAAFARPENATRGVVAIEGRMVERLHLDQARALLATAAAIAARADGGD